LSLVLISILIFVITLGAGLLGLYVHKCCRLNKRTTAPAALSVDVGESRMSMAFSLVTRAPRGVTPGSPARFFAILPSFLSGLPRFGSQ
jgi:hypothetical protein